MKRLELDGLWRNRDFMKLWGGQTVSVFGTMISGAAIPFTAVIALDAGAVEVALLSAVRIVPALLFGLPAGVWVDRLRRRPVMIACDIGRALILATVPIAWAFDLLEMPQLYIVAFGAGVLNTFFAVAYRSYLPTVVERTELLEGNSKLTASSAAAEFGGFSVSGVLVQVFSGPIAVGVDAVSFVASALFLRSIEREEPPPKPPEAHETVAYEARQGLGFVRRTPVLIAVCGAMALYSFGFGVFGALYTLFVVDSLGFKPGVLGVIYGIGGVSSLIGAVLAARAASRFGTGPSMAIGVAMMGASMSLIAVAPEAGLVATVLLIAQQVSGDGMFTVYDVNEVSLRQSITPDGMLGRVNSFTYLMENSLQLVGALAGGLLGATLGLRTTMALGSAFTVAAGALLALSPVMRVRDVPAEVHPVAAEA